MRVMNLLEEHAPTVLSIVGIAGFVSAIVITARVAPKAAHILEESKTKARKEQAIALAPVYAPVAGLALISTGCILAGGRIHQYRYASVLALLAVSERNLERWQKSIFEEVGEKKAEAVRRRVVEPTGDIPQDADLDEVKQLFFDTYTGRYFRAHSVEVIKAAVNEINEMVVGEGFASLNEYYYILGLENTDFGDVIGWSISTGLMSASFDSFLKNDRPVVSVDFNVKPREYTSH